MASVQLSVEARIGDRSEGLGFDVGDAVAGATVEAVDFSHTTIVAATDNSGVATLELPPT